MARRLHPIQSPNESSRTPTLIVGLRLTAFAVGFLVAFAPDLRAFGMELGSGYRLAGIPGLKSIGGTVFLPPLGASEGKGLGRHPVDVSRKRLGRLTTGLSVVGQVRQRGLLLAVSLAPDNVSAALRVVRPVRLFLSFGFFGAHVTKKKPPVFSRRPCWGWRVT